MRCSLPVGLKKPTVWKNNELSDGDFVVAGSLLAIAPIVNWVYVFGLGFVFKGITVFKIFIWGGILSDIRSEI